MNARILLTAALTLIPTAVLAAVPATGHTDREPATDVRPAAEAQRAPLLAELTRLNRDRGRCGQ